MKKSILLYCFLWLCIACNNASKNDKEKTQNPNEQRGAVVADKVNIREEPTIDAKVLGLLREKEQIFILETGIKGRSREATLKEDIDFFDEMNDYVLTAHKGMAVKIISYKKDEDAYSVYLYLRQQKLKATVPKQMLEFIGNEKWVKIKTEKGITGYCLEKYIATEELSGKAAAKSSEKREIELFKSKDMGYVEYMKRVIYSNGNYDWFYYTEKNPKEVKLGKNETDVESVYFYKNPDKIYEIGYSECGFTVFNPDGTMQWYQQIDPPCSLSN
jgi:hypothetical protein